MVGGGEKGKKKENLTEEEIEANVQVLSQEIMSWEALKEVRSSDAEGPNGTGFFDESAQGRQFCGFVFTERGGQSKQIAIDRCKTLREGGRKWRKSILGGKRDDRAYKKEKGAHYCINTCHVVYAQYSTVYCYYSCYHHHYYY